MRARALVSGAIMAVVLLLGVAHPAHGAGSDLEFSSDGVSWSALPPASLFPSGIVLVPGGATSATVWVRNANEEPGVLVTAVTNIQTEGADAGFGFGLESSDDRVVQQDRIAFDRLVDCTHLSSARALGPGDVSEISVTIDLGAYLTGDQAQHDSVSFELWFGLADARGLSADGCPESPVVIPSEPGGAVPSSGTLPITGGGLELGAAAVGLAMGGVGWLLARRRHPEE